jgi:hypothetical protein
MAIAGKRRVLNDRRTAKRRQENGNTIALSSSSSLSPQASVEPRAATFTRQLFRCRHQKKNCGKCVGQLSTKSLKETCGVPQMEKLTEAC